MKDQLPPMLNIGFYNYVQTSRIIAMVSSESAPMRRLIRHLRQESNLLIDATQGRRTKSLIFMDSGHVVLSAISQETLMRRLARGEME